MKLKTLLFTLLMLSCTGLAFGATVTVGKPYYTANNTVTVPVMLANNGASISILSLDLTYDPALYSAPVGTVGTAASSVGKALYGNVISSGKYRLLIAGGMTESATDPKGGSLNDASTGTSAALPDGVVATVTFTPSGSTLSDITLSGAADAADAQANQVAVNGVVGGTSGTQSIGKIGDCNASGTVSAADLQYAINIVIKKPGFTYNNLCDVNLVSGTVTPDGKTTATDVQTLINVLIKKAGWVLP
ncbi:cohesin domain-containing protein [Geomonas oryzae]|uniref:cohesin domain-containing protein n=1 Tax=Geomonas oryzae TaxID=2364273 RepID=UPI00100B6488|nr:cohesin domain-containing protein [Geomonas oryzae]